MARAIRRRSSDARLRSEQAVVGVERPVGQFLRRRQPGREIDHVDGAGRDDLRDSRSSGVLQSVRARIHHRAGELVGDLLQAEVQHRGEAALCRDRFHRAAAHAGGVEDNDLVAAPFELRLQFDHVAEAALAERGDRDHRPLIPRPDGAPGRADDRAAGLRQHRLAGAVEAVEAAGPQDHHQVGGDALGRDQVRECDRRNDQLRHAERQRLRDVEREIRSHRAADGDDGVDDVGCREVARQIGRAVRHQRHRRILVTAGCNRRDRRLRRRSHGVLVVAGRVGRIAEHADVHHDRYAAGSGDAIAHEQEFVGLGVSGSDQEDSRLCNLGHDLSVARRLAGRRFGRFDRTERAGRSAIDGTLWALSPPRHQPIG